MSHTQTQQQKTTIYTILCQNLLVQDMEPKVGHLSHMFLLSRAHLFDQEFNIVMWKNIVILKTL
jgi:hypothetical protein